MDDLGVDCVRRKWASLVWCIHFASASFLGLLCLGRTLFDSWFGLGGNISTRIYTLHWLVNIVHMSGRHLSSYLH
ncbi:hypothetical protein IQ06DRAFT_139616 [Phaeosphaeriaceae sp. SRC1lsM3a]|nr:hypothetical protein IQ06DRAFT_139616 [Stagonospora sp. SRC1lsM3a]